MSEILIVEGDGQYGERMAKIARNGVPGTAVRVARNENEAYAVAIKNKIDAFIVDITLHPGLRGGDDSGASFIHDIRSVDRYRFTPVITVSNLCDQEMNMYVNESCYLFLEKPVDEKVFARAISDAVKYRAADGSGGCAYFHHRGILQSVFARDILYMENRIKMLRIYTGKKHIKIPRKTFKNILEELGSDSFIKCGREIIVNMAYIKIVDRVNRYVLLEGIPEALDISASAAGNFFEELANKARLV